MSSLTTHVVPKAATITIIADPDQTPESTGVEPDGILVWTNRSQAYPTFEIVFEGPSPASPKDVLIGAGSVVVHVSQKGTFGYKIRHIPECGDIRESSHKFVESCTGCSR
jgi:hypothetical protein